MAAEKENVLITTPKRGGFEQHGCFDGEDLTHLWSWTDANAVILLISF